ncbi:unnamed protein product [Lymnaea stagnalis]|uniref:Uncharacterized protein n=1 Tax=Lymnaea stagnalis TaxID=6523 RepID=A0AAV2I5N5_LYMST
MNCFLVSVIICILGLCGAQLHDAVSQGVTCYDCLQTETFQECLRTQMTCPAGDVCSISYTRDTYKVTCQTQHECSVATSGAWGPCSTGGLDVGSGTCQMCCKATSCVSNMVSRLTTLFDINVELFCPGECSSRDIASCITFGTYCSKGEFCEVGVNSSLAVHGSCKSDSLLRTCESDKASLNCLYPVGNNGHPARCVWDCCATDACLLGHFGKYWDVVPSRTSFPPATSTQQPSTTHEPVTSASSSTTQQPPHITLLPPTTLETHVVTPLAVVTSGTIETHMDHPVYCQSCSGDDCTTSTNVAYCQQGFCKVTIADDATGARLLSKSCSNRAECRAQWWDVTSKDKRCMDALTSVASSTHLSLTCHFCCQTDHCSDVLPPNNLTKF